MMDIFEVQAFDGQGNFEEAQLSLGLHQHDYKHLLIQLMNHLCIINMKNVFNTSNFLFFLLELAKGQELFNKIIEKTKLNEAEAKLTFFQITSAITYLYL